MRDTARAVAVVVAAVAQIAGSPLGTALAGRSVGEISERTQSLITPAGYAFTIWAVIFAGSLAWAVYQALPSQRDRALHRRTGWPLALAFAGNALWEVLFPLVGVSQPVVPAVLLLGIVAATAVAWSRVQDLRSQGLDRLLPTAVAGLLLGWVTVAAAVNLASAGVALGAPATGGQARVWAVFALVAVAVLASAIVLSAQAAAGAFALAVAWGLVAIAVEGGPSVVTVSALAAAATVVVALGVRAAVRPDPASLLVG